MERTLLELLRADQLSFLNQSLDDLLCHGSGFGGALELTVAPAVVGPAFGLGVDARVKIAAELYQEVPDVTRIGHSSSLPAQAVDVDGAGDHSLTGAGDHRLNTAHVVDDLGQSSVA